MNILESIKVSVSAIFANKLRSLLTMLGIIIGISSVITIVALGEGSKKAIDEEFALFGTGKAFVMINWEEDSSSKDLFTNDDLDIVRDAFKDELVSIMPSVGTRGTLKSTNKDVTLEISAADEAVSKVASINITSGRSIFKEDILSKNMVALMNEKTAKSVFGSTDVLGRYLDMEINGKLQSFTIVGLYKEPESKLRQMGGESNGVIYTPYTTIGKITGQDDNFYYLNILVKDGYSSKDVTDKIVNLIERRHDNEGKNMYMVQTAEGELKSINNVMGIVTLIIGAIAAISLLVGGIGIMNIMFVSVTERTREIGIRKAIGAKRKDILLQFLVESVIISIIGGIIGTVFGIGFAYIASIFIKFPPSISLRTIAIAWIFSAGVGIFFGLYPANKASKLDPIDALRYE